MSDVLDRARQRAHIIGNAMLTADEDMILELVRKVISLQAENEQLRAFIEPLAHCPCCARDKECLTSCTYRIDSERWGKFDSWEMMRAVRQVLAGEVLRDGALGEAWAAWAKMSR